MADNEVLIQIKADVADINAKLSDIKGNISKVTDETKKMGSESKTQWEMMAAGIASTIYIVQQVIQKFEQLAGYIGDPAKAYGQAETSGLKLNAVLAAHNVGDLTEAYKEYANQVQDLTGIHHTEIEGLQAVLTTMGVIPSQMEDAIQAAIALHNVFGKDLTSSAELVAQAMEGNVRGLQKLIPQLKGAEVGSMSAADVMKILGNSLGDINEQLGDTYLVKLEKFNSSWRDFKETIIEPLIPMLKSMLDTMTDIVKKTPSLLKMALMNPGEVLPLPGDPGYIGPSKGSMTQEQMAAMFSAGDKNFVKPPSHLLDSLLKSWKEKSPQLEQQTFMDTMLFGDATKGLSTEKIASMVSPVFAQAAKLQEQFKALGGKASGVIDQWLFGQLHAEDVKASLEMVKDSWQWFEQSKLLENRTAMNKVMNDELAITLALSDADRQRQNYQITESQLIQAQIDATKRQIQAETDRYNAMRPSGTQGDWTALNEQGQKIDLLRDKIKGLQDQLARTSTPQTVVIALRKYADESADVWKQIGDAATNALKGMEDALVNFVQTGKLNFTNLANSIIADLTRIAVKSSITGPAGSMFSGMFGNLAKGGDLSGLADIYGGVFKGDYSLNFANFLAGIDHGGGVNESRSFRFVPAAAFAGAPRYHSGIGPDERPAILQKDEGVFTPGQMKALGNKISGGGSDQSPAYLININAVDSKSFEDYMKRNPKPVINTIDQAIKDNSGLRSTIKRFTR